MFNTQYVKYHIWMLS